MNETVYILLPVHNRCEVTRRFIACLKVQTYQNYHLVLIDDGSTDGTADMVRDQIISATVIRGKGDWWWAGSLQQGYLWLQKRGVSNSSVILIINDDTVFDPEFIEKALLLFMGQLRMLLLAQCYSLQDGRLIDSGLHLDWQAFTCLHAEDPGLINCMSTRGLFLRWSDFTEIGGFFPKLLPHYYSDYEFTVRAYRKGFRLYTDSSLKLWGDESTTGAHVVEAESIWSTVTQLFSIKTIPNPAVISVYIILACPYRWIFINLLRIWHNAFNVLREALLKDFYRIFSLNVK